MSDSECSFRIDGTTRASVLTHPRISALTRRPYKIREEVAYEVRRRAGAKGLQSSRLYDSTRFKHRDSVAEDCGFPQIMGHVERSRLSRREEFAKDP